MNIIENNWLRIGLLILGIVALFLWHQQQTENLKWQRVRDFWDCQKGNDSSEWSLCVSLYPDESGVKLNK